MKLHQGLHILLIFCLAFGVVSKALADDDDVINGPEDTEGTVRRQIPQNDNSSLDPELYNNADPSKNLVELHYRRDTLRPYMDRRNANGFEYSVGYQTVDVSKFIVPTSSSTTGPSYKSSLGLTTVNLDYKRNVEFGSFTGGVSLGQSGSTLMTMMTYGVGIRFIADAIGEEPYIAPYVGASYQQMQISEKDAALDTSATVSGSGLVLTVGAMFQLNWIDPTSAEYATFHFGLENTFLNVFVSEYSSMATNNADDPSSFLMYGAGLVLEF